MVVRDGKDVIAPKVHAIVRIVLHPIRAALFSIVTIRTIIKGKGVSERVSLRERKKCHRPRLKSSLLFFLDLRFLKGHLDWHIGCLEPTLSLSHPSSAL
jgi:hypothetical protein